MASSIKSIWHKILHPSSSALIFYYLVFLGSITADVVCICNSRIKSWYGIIFLAVSIICIVYGTYLLILAFKLAESKIKVRFHDRKIVDMIFNYNFRSIVGTLFSFLINAVYAVFLGSLSLMSGSLWYGALTLYYITMSVNRGSLVLKYSTIHTQNLTHIETQLNKTKAYRNSGIMLLVSTLALGVFVIVMLVRPESMPFVDILIYPVAIFTFYKIVISIINLFKAQKHDDIAVQASRNINFAMAMVSVLTLQVNLFQVFEAKNPTSYNAVSGAIICLLIIVIGIFMIVNGSKKIDNFNHITRMKKSGD